MRKNALLALSLLFYCQANTQSITQATIGSMGGQFKNGNITLGFTIGETLVGTQSNGTVRLGNGFWTIVPISYVPAAAIVYRFTGNGHFFNAANWQGGQVPPNPLPAGSEILIEPAGTGECLLNAPYNISPGAKFSVVAGKKFLIPGFLQIVKP